MNDEWLEPFGALGALVERSRLDAEALRAGPAPVSRWPAPGWEGLAAGVPLAEPVIDGAAIETVLRRRRSVRHYAPDSVTAEEVATVLRAARAADEAHFAGERAAGVSVDLMLAARRVDGVERRLHVLREDPDRLCPVTDLPDEADAADLVLQREYADSPALVLVLGALGAALERHGDHGYRLMLLRAGAVAHAGWLAADALGLDATVFAGLLPSAVTALTGSDGFTRGQLFGLTFGAPLER